MPIQEVLRVINQMRSDGVIEEYAIGGAVAATFYLEPIDTLDIDVFVAFAPQPGALLLTLTPLYSYLQGHGCAVEGEYVHIADWPVQFLPPTGPLIEDALRTAREIDVDGTTARVFSLEHLAAIALQTGRSKDKARLLQFFDSGILDRTRFQELVERHGLTKPWHKFERQYLADE